MPYDDEIKDDDFLTRIEIALDGETRRRLISVADETHSDPATIAAVLLHDILKDDEEAHASVDLGELADDDIESNVIDLRKYLH